MAVTSLTAQRRLSVVVEAASGGAPRLVVHVSGRTAHVRPATVHEREHALRPLFSYRLTCSNYTGSTSYCYF